MCEGGQADEKRKEIFAENEPKNKYFTKKYKQSYENV